MNEPCRLCGSEPEVATYYDFYVFHCPTPGCPYHLGGWKVANGKGKWYGSIDEARDAWNQRQRSTIRTACRRGETTSAPETVKPEPEPVEAENEPEIGEIAWHREVIDGYSPSDCPYCGCERVVIGEYEPCHDDEWSYCVEHKDAKRAVERRCFTMYAAFKTPEDAVRSANRRVAQLAYVDVVSKPYGSLGAESEPADAENRPQDGSECADSRDKLEEAMHNVIRDALLNLQTAIMQCVEQGMDVLSFDEGEFVDYEHDEYVGEYLSRAMRLLDRQAAITRRETRQSWQDVPNVLDRTNLETIAKLTAERDYWKSQTNKCLNHVTDTYLPEVMEYPRDKDKACEPSLLVIDELDNLRDLLAEACGDAATFKAERDQLSRDLTAEHALLRQFEDDNEQLREHVADLTADAKRWADAANVQRLVAMGQADKVQELTAERDELKAEVEAQRKRANDAERGVLSEEWYVSRDRYEDEIAELKAEHDNLQERFLAVYDIKNERDRLKDVVQKQADSFAKMERELHDAKVDAKRNRDGMDALKEKCQEQREELARLNAKMRGKRRLPKKVVWPRDEKGKLVTLNALGAKNILFDSNGYLIEYRDGTTRYETYKQAKEALNAEEG